MDNKARAKRLRQIAWRMNLWDAGFIDCCVYSTDFELVDGFKGLYEWFRDMTNDEQFLFVLFVAEVLEQGGLDA